MTSRDTSLEAYQIIVEEGKVATQEQKVYDFIKDNPFITRNQISRKMGIPINAVCGRVHKLLNSKTNRIEETGKVFDELSGKRNYALVTTNG